MVNYSAHGIRATQLEEAHRRVWWNDTDAVRRFVCDLVGAELALLRPTGLTVPPLPWPISTHLHDDLGADSLELFQLGTALVEALHLHESGIADHLLARPTLADWIDIAQTGLNAFSLSITFRTSGSTGTAKSCTHSLDSLWQEALELASLFPARQRILSAVPCHHIYGFLFTILLPRALAFSDTGVIDLRGSSPASLRRLVQRGDLIIAHPMFWQAAATTLSGLPQDVDGVTSTAPCPDSASIALRAAGLNRLVQIFGSSETAGIGWREHESASYTLFRHWSRAADNANKLTRCLSDGSAASLICPDQLEWHDDRRFLPAGRIDGAVQVGGLNVYPAVVRRALLEHPEVADAAVRLMRSDEGNRLKAFIVPHDVKINTDELQQRLMKWVVKRLMPAEQPKAFSFGLQCPAGPSGKAADWMM